MNCSQCQEELVAYVEGLLDPAQAQRLEVHLADCPGCRSELEELRRLVDLLDHDGSVARQAALATGVMDRIVCEQAIELRRLQMRRRFRWIGLSGAAAAAILLAGISVFWSARMENATAAEATAAKTLAQGAEAGSKVSNIHIEGEMRTLPNDNFSLIFAEAEPVRIDVWEQFGAPSKWRVEKPGRVAVMDGSSTVMWIKASNVAVKVGASQAAFDTAWLLRLTKVGDLLNNELRTALAKNWDLSRTQEKAKDGTPILVVTVEAKEGLPEGNYMKNKFLDTADTRRVYRFDAQTKRLQGLDIYLHQKTGDKLIFEVTKIQYDQPIDPSVFTLKLPENVGWHHEPQKLPDNQKYEQMTPQQTARAFFEACGKEDWAEVQKFYGTPPTDRMKQYLGGLKIVRLGEPFQAKPYAGWFVPYEIEFKGGEVKKHNLAVRNDNPAKRYVVDGGL
jgi:outer membrane lipoprotein-sorting protein